MERQTIIPATSRWSKPAALEGALIGLQMIALVAHAQTDPTRMLLNPDPILPAEGAKVFSANCLACHGGNGDGWGPLAVNLPNKPRSFTDQAWMANHADGTFFTSTSRGIPGTSMPAFADRLSEREIWAAIAYIRGFAPLRAATEVTVGPTASLRWTAKVGALLYSQQCSGCHGSGGRGDGPAAAFFTRAPRDLTNRDWMASRSDEQLRGVVRYGVPGSPMPGFILELRDDEITSLIGYLRTVSGTRPGKNAVRGIGVSLYGQNCAACHGAEGNGDGPGANQLAPRPLDFRNPSWMAAQTDEQLGVAILGGRPGTHMPPFRALLTRAEVAALVQYLRGFAQAVPGAGASRMVPPDASPGSDAVLSTPPPQNMKGNP
jgi:mono/diheme cytochrome c family protein